MKNLYFREDAADLKAPDLAENISICFFYLSQYAEVGPYKWDF